MRFDKREVSITTPEAQELVEVFVHISQTLRTHWSGEVRHEAQVDTAQAVFDAAYNRAIVGQT
eukprot:71100-Alexandrium_andersonii.AAC.1